MNSNRTGDISELRACAWALSKGYEVFRNVACTGPADLVLVSDGRPPVLVDVKTATKFSGAGAPRAAKLTNSQLKRGVRRLWITEASEGGIDAGDNVNCSKDYGDF